MAKELLILQAIPKGSDDIRLGSFNSPLGVIDMLNEIFSVISWTSDGIKFSGLLAVDELRAEFSITKNRAFKTSTTSGYVLTAILYGGNKAGIEIERLCKFHNWIAYDLSTLKPIKYKELGELKLKKRFLSLFSFWFKNRKK